MQEQGRSTTGTTDHKKSTKESPLVEVEKTIRAAPEEVFEAWSSADLVKQWWGPEHFDCPSAKSDFRVGGEYLYAMRGEDGDTNWSTGRFIEIEPNRRIVYTDSFSDSEGKLMNPKGFEDFGETFVTVEIEPMGESETKMRLSHAGIPARMHDDCVDGWSSTLDKMKKLVERH